MGKIAVATVSEDDRAAIAKLTRTVHEETVFGDIPFSRSKFERLFDQTLQQPDRHLGLKVGLGTRVLGCSYCTFGGYFIGENAHIVTVNTICVSPDVRHGLLGGKVALRLLQGIEVWARARDAEFVLYHVTSGVMARNADRFFRKAGMTTLGGSYALKLRR